MASDRNWPVPVVSVGPCAAGTSLWRMDGQLHLAVIVKATFELAAAGDLEPVEAEPVHPADRFDAHQPWGSLSGVRETWPPLPRAEVILLGHAYPPPGQPAVGQRRVRVTVGRGGQTLVDKVALAVGNRRSGAEPEPFSRMPLTWERALGGIGSPTNPLGTGWGASSERLPNVVCLQDPTGTAACFGPVPAAFPERKALLGDVSRGALDGSIGEIPDGFRHEYFQSASEDQRAEAWGGDEWIELEGVLERHDSVRVNLPGLQATARLLDAVPPGVPELFPLRGDLLVIEPDRGRCSLVWRACVALPDEAVLGTLVAAGAVASPGAAVSWPTGDQARQQLAARSAPVATAPVSAPVGLSSTEVMDPVGGAGAAAGAAPGAVVQPDQTVALSPAGEPRGASAVDPASGPAPFELAQAGRAAGTSQLPGAPWSNEPAQAVSIPELGQASTLNITAEQVAAATAQFAPSPPASTPVAPAPPEASSPVAAPPSVVAAPPPGPGPIAVGEPTEEAHASSPPAPVPRAVEGDARSSAEEPEEVPFRLPDLSTPAAAAEPAGDPQPQAADEPRRAARKTAAVAQVPAQASNPAARIYGSIAGAIKKRK